MKVADELSFSAKVTVVFLARQPRPDALTAHARRPSTISKVCLRGSGLLRMRQPERLILRCRSQRSRISPLDFGNPQLIMRIPTLLPNALCCKVFGVLLPFPDGTFVREVCHRAMTRYANPGSLDRPFFGQAFLLPIVYPVIRNNACKVWPCGLVPRRHSHNFASLLVRGSISVPERTGVNGAEIWDGSSQSPAHCL